METFEQGREMSASDFASLGVHDVAYVKTVVVDGKPGFAIHAADGTPMAVVAKRDVAFALIRQNDLEGQSVH